MLKKVLKILGLVVICILITVSTYVYLSVPDLSEKTDKTIHNVLNSPVPEFIKGDTGHIVNENIRVWYESILPADTIKGSILLFMGISNDALGWPQSFLDTLVNSGYQVIRFDYRGTGLSDWCEDKEKQIYSLKDIAEDSKIILDSLNVKKVNLLGVSMGGMVAQDFAIHYPERSTTLTCIMSSGNILDKELPPISMKIVGEFIKLNLRYGIFPTEKNTAKLHISSRIILKGNAEYEIDVKETAQQVIFNLRKRNGFNIKVSKQHNEAVYNSGSRYEQLAKLKLPVLIIHGKNDPFIPIEHSYKLVRTIPKAKTLLIENMGHDIPTCHYELICNKLYRFFRANETEF